MIVRVLIGKIVVGKMAIYIASPLSVIPSPVQFTIRIVSSSKVIRSARPGKRILANEAVSINMICRIVMTVYEQLRTKNITIIATEYISIDKSTNDLVVISIIQIIQPCFFIANAHNELESLFNFQHALSPVIKEFAGTRYERCDKNNESEVGGVGDMLRIERIVLFYFSLTREQKLGFPCWMLPTYPLNLKKFYYELVWIKVSSSLVNGSNSRLILGKKFLLYFLSKSIESG